MASEDYSLTERLVVLHSAGTAPDTLTLDTPANVSGYWERMSAATAKRMLADRRAQQASIERSRTRPVD
jgi:hypothetical protein